MTQRKRRNSSPTTAKRVVAYVRVSSRQQAESGLSIEAQREKVAAYAKLHDLTLVDVVEDAGASAKDLDRPGLNAALGMLESGAADALLVCKLDRLSRSLKDWTGLIERYFGDGAAHPAALFSVGDSIDTTSAAGRLVLNVLMSVAAWEREVISERTIDALDAKRARGETWNEHGGRSAIGRAGDADIADRIRALRAEGLSIREIADRLNADAVPCRGKRWHHTTVARVLSRAA